MDFGAWQSSCKNLRIKMVKRQAMIFGLWQE